MATSNANGLLKLHSDIRVNGDSSELIQSIVNNNFLDEFESKVGNLLHTMVPKPRTECLAPDSVDELHTGYHKSDYVHNMYSNSSFLDRSSSDYRINAAHDTFCESRLQSALNHHASLKDEEDACTNQWQQCTQRLEHSAQRLENMRSKCSTLLRRLILNNRTVETSSAPSTALPTSFCGALMGDETESSTDDEDVDSASVPSIAEENRLCNRAVSCSNWHWLSSEIRRSEIRLEKLQNLRSDLRKRKCLHTQDKVSVTIPESSCSRTRPHGAPWRQRTYHRLSMLRSANSLLAPDDVHKPNVVRCNCIPPSSGPCIICCHPVRHEPVDERSNKSRCVDIMACAEPLGAHIHPKLSLHGDVPLGLRLESRLAAFAPVTYREHKTTAVPVPNVDIPICFNRPELARRTSVHPSSPPVSSTPRNSTSISQTLQPSDRIQPTRANASKSHNPLLTRRSLTQTRKTLHGQSTLHRILDLASTDVNYSPH